MVKKLGLAIAAIVVAAFSAMPAMADAQDFTFESLDANYLITRDASNVSQLYVREKLVAVFPQTDQNHGILRAIPQSYKGHSVELKIDSVAHADGTLYAYDTYTENDNTVLKIGDPAKYVHGKQTYIIDYHLRGVTLNFDDHDEFYWDINGDQWQQPFGKVRVRVHVDDAARGNVPASAITPRAVCFTGAVGSNASNCRVAPDENGITFETTRTLEPRETLTVVMGFTKGTFAPYSPSPQLILAWTFKVLAWAVPPLIALWVVVHKWRRFGRDPKGRGVIVPQYIPPKDVSVLQSQVVIKEAFDTKAITATIINLAVRHYIKIYEAKTNPTAKKPDDYEIELVKPGSSLRADEQQVLGLLFSDISAAGSRVALKTLGDTLALAAHKVGEAVGTDLATNGYFKVAPQKAKTPYIIWGILLFIGGFVALPFSLGLTAAGIVVLLAVKAMPARTIKGVELRDYLLGLRDYMQLAEADRLKVLQSPHGALTEKVNIDDKRQLVKLYERLLPYAMLFGIEKEWAAQFASLYTREPDWYHGRGVFHAAYFASAVGDFSTTSAATFAPASSGSGSGFSGGSSGGGGGGGGGGGW